MSKLSSIEELFAGRHFDREVIILCVRWYLRYKLSFRDLVEMMAERVLSLAHTTIMRWVRRYASEGSGANTRVSWVVATLGANLHLCSKHGIPYCRRSLASAP
jgi:hypothetical protein